MDALILSCGMGGGHNAAGAAVKEELQKRGHHVVMMNPYQLKSGKLAMFINQSYVKLVQKVPAAFGLIYQLGEAYRRLPFRSPVYFLNTKMSFLLQDYLSRNHFDVVIMPHIFPAHILSGMRAKGIDIPKTIFIATDYACIPFTEDAECDAYVIPAEELREEFIRYKIPTEKIYALGIPVRNAFVNPVSREQAVRSLKLNPDKKYILVSGGSMGAGKIGKVARILKEWKKEDSQHEVIVLCGNNHRLYWRMRWKYRGEILLQKYTTQMADYMKASEMILTKPGGLSTTEAAVAGIPIVHITPIPGCESRNMQYFANHGMSIAARQLQEDLPAAVKMLQDKGKRNEMAEKQKQGINRFAARDICNLAEKLAEEQNT